MGASLRPATADDAVVALPWIESASGPILTHLFGLGRDHARARAVVTRAFRADEGPFSHRHAVIVTDDGRPRGMALAMSARDKPRIERAMSAQILREYRATELPRFALHALTALVFGVGVPGDSYYLSVLGVDAESRGRGHGSLLLARVLDDAARSGCRRCMLHVSVKNGRARALYERHGFRVVGECSNRRLEARYGLEAQLRMERAVGASAT